MFCIHRSVKFLDLLLKLITSCFYLFVHSKCTKFVSSPLTIQHANTTRPYMIRVLQEVDQVLKRFVFHLNWFELIYRCSKIEFILFRFIATATKICFVNKSSRLTKLSDNEMVIQNKTVGLAVNNVFNLYHLFQFLYSC